MSARRSSDRIAECLALAGVLALALLFAARAMIPALSPDVVQDDARQYTFWTGRLHDPQLFRDDPLPTTTNRWLRQDLPHCTGQ